LYLDISDFRRYHHVLNVRAREWGQRARSGFRIALFGTFKLVGDRAPLWFDVFVSRQGASVFLNALSHPRRQRLLGVTQVVGHLQVHPEFRRRFEKHFQTDRLRARVCRAAQRFKNSSLRILPGASPNQANP
jgi:hypothetical protein